MNDETRNNKSEMPAEAHIEIPLADLIKIRRQKIEQLEKLGITPYPYKYERTHSISAILANFEALAQGEAVLTSDLSLRPARDSSAHLEEMGLEEVERFLIQKALQRFQGNVSEAARFLGLSRSGLYRRLQKYGL